MKPKAVHCKSIGTLANEDDTLHKEQRERLRKNRERTELDEQLEALWHKNAQMIIMTKTPRRFKLKNRKDLEKIRQQAKYLPSNRMLDMLGLDGGHVSIGRYCWPFEKYSFKTAGINEEYLIGGIKEIRGDCDLTSSSLKSLKSVRKIGGNLIIPYFTKLEDLSGLEEVRGKIVCETRNPQDGLEKLKSLNLRPELLEKFSPEL